MQAAQALLIGGSLVSLAACGLLGSTASTVGSLGSQASSAASQGSGASSGLLSGGDTADGTAPVGQICGQPGLSGRVIPAIVGTGGCGVPGAVQVASVAGVALSPEPTLSCTTALALNTWVADSVKPEIRATGERLGTIRISAHYACGPADGPGHGTGEALDIAGFDLADGTTLSVAEAWADPERGPLLQSLHQRACGPFSETLGPWTGTGSPNALHYDTVSRAALHCR
jgi:hypothetical protein